MAEAMTVVPGQWPPIGATKAMLSKYEQGTTAQETPPKDEPDVQMTTPAAPVPPGDRPLQQLSAQQLKLEIARLERHILEMPQDGYGPLRDALEDNLAITKAELLARKPEGQALDQAVAKHKQAIKARQVAEANLEKARQSLQLATTALEQTTSAEELAAQEVQKQRAAISEFDPLPAASPALPSPTVVGLYQILQQAGLPDNHLKAVADLLGTRLPPAPPQMNSTPPPAVPQAQQQTQAPTTAPPSVAPCAAHDHLEHPARLASQLLASESSKKSLTTGTGPKTRRPLPARGGLADYASTFRQRSSSPAHSATTSRSASRSVDRGHNRKNSPHVPIGALSPTVPMDNATQAVPSSLDGAAPPS